MQRSAAAKHVLSSDPLSSSEKVLDDFYALRKTLRARNVDVWMPPTDVYETPTDVVVKMSLPGVHTADIGIEFNGSVMTICGLRNPEQVPDISVYHQLEIRNGYFERRIVINIPFDPAGLRYEYERGFLWLYVPKTQQMTHHVLAIRLKF